MLEGAACDRDSWGNDDTDMSKDDEEDKKNKSLGPLRKLRLRLLKLRLLLVMLGKTHVCLLTLPR